MVGGFSGALKNEQNGDCLQVQWHKDIHMQTTPVQCVELDNGGESETREGFREKVVFLWLSKSRYEFDM